MLPILLFLLFAPSLYAGDFPNLMKAVHVTWDDVDLTANVTTNLTTSVDGQVPYFVLCGPLPTSRALCTYDYTYSVPNPPYYIETFFGQGVSYPNLVYVYANNNTCLSIKNDIADFVSVYENTQKYGDDPNWKFDLPFVCHTVQPSSNVLKYSIIGAVSFILLAAAVFAGFKIGQKKSNKTGETSSYASFNQSA